MWRSAEDGPAVAFVLAAATEPVPASALEALPAVPDCGGARRAIQTALLEQRAKVVVLDDDPTGTQLVSDVPVIMTAELDDIRWALASPGSCCFVETDSRSLVPAAARALAEELGQRLGQAARELEIELRCISRSDSTLRGHFPDEVLALDRGLQAAGLPASETIVFCPAFPSAGRLTAWDVHWLRDGDQLTPVAKTEFARDAAFAYSHSDLREWVAERVGEPLRAADVGSISIEDLRLGGPQQVAERLCAGGYVVVNAIVQEDLEIFVLGLQLAEGHGRRFALRSGPSLVAARAGLVPRLVDAGALRGPERGDSGLVVVGSHTELTNRQLSRALTRHRLGVVELGVEAVLDPKGGERAVAEAATDLLAALDGGDAALVTSRAVSIAKGHQALEASRRVADAVADVVARVDAARSLGFLVAKGGITSSEVARRGLGARRAHVVGQLFPGLVAVWEIIRADRPPLNYVVFPGNVGNDDALADALTRMKRAR